MSDLPRFIPDAPDGDGSGGHVLIEIEPPKIRTLDARLGRVVASAEHGFSRLELDAAPRLAELPRGASVVFVLDVSRSVDPELLAAQLRVVAAYLAHVPDAKVELVVFDRQARRVFGEFVNASVFPEALLLAQSGGKLAFGNGSALEEGLGLAAATLAERRGPTRIVALTDARLRSSFVPRVAARELASASRTAITHLVIPEDGYSAALRRDDGHVLAGIAAAQRGVLFTAVVPEADKALPAQMLGLVRPVTIDHFKVAGIDLSGAAEVPDSLREGVGYRAMIASADPTRRVVVSGKIWARTLHRVVEHNDSFDDATAAFVFSEDEHHALSPEEMRTVAYKGRAVSPVTSYLATEPGVRPSTEGLLELEGFGGLGLVGTGRGGGGAGSGSISITLPRLSDLLAEPVANCVRRHAAGVGWSVALKVETTGPEVVDVVVTRASHAALRECVVAAVWALELPGGFPERESHDLDFTGAVP